MDLIKCPACSKEISPQATACPSCGQPIATAKTKRKTSILTIGCATLLGLGLLGYIIQLFSGGSSSTSTAPDSQVSQNIVLNSKGDDKVYVFRDQDAVKEFLKLVAAKDGVGIINMVLVEKKAFTVNQNTKALVIDKETGLRQVRIMDGDHFGDSGWVFMEDAH